MTPTHPDAARAEVVELLVPFFERAREFLVGLPEPQKNFVPSAWARVAADALLAFVQQHPMSELKADLVRVRGALEETRETWRFALAIIRQQESERDLVPFEAVHDPIGKIDAALEGRG